ncbi:Glycoprotein-N-acetylgalactosamine 3-beta-galactosyltransferase 1 [Clonorchis sinensis]|uniref:Glycoprotein-N-acetylgalactosamine 3-beta-galactosyltransferase n=2 Tax=Clonorchis sinensis TaxID=79923 RepID=G7Y7V0_CLOSI|nr:Glycoprotein-N-acetylgalactosamine 3-beta-galactosyltransferase 1 [Clonorchis sinensis]GAA49035.1 glycoprotein-N-acetylgalactosamine 3-beta-galactosyltransferase [Clonorchis sinensis]
MDISRHHCSVRHWLRSSFPLLLGMIFGHLSFGILQWTGKEKLITCAVTKISRTVYPWTTIRKPRILCYINTYPPNYDTKAIHVQNTWARRCDEFYFTSTVSHPSLSVLVLNMTEPEVREHLWVKMRKILRAIHQMADAYDYFLKADDDTYAFLSNLREFLVNNGDPTESVMWGYRWKTLCPGGYFSGGAGYVLTREALKRIVERAIDRHPDCPNTDEDKEDVKMCICGRAVGVTLEDAETADGKKLFYPYNIIKTAKDMTWNLKNMLNQTKITDSDMERFQSLSLAQLGFSRSHISFHYIEGSEMYILEFLTYFLRPVGLES